MREKSRDVTRWVLMAFVGSGFGASMAFGDAVPVRIIESNGISLMLREDQPYFIKGAGGNGDLKLLAAIGGNSIRTWGDTTLEQLDQAHEAGLTVCVGLWIDHERHGFDYSNDDLVAAQIKRHCETIDRLKDHPAVLMWGIGNEVELQHENPRVWEVIEAVAAHAKRVDPHHPTMTVIAQAPEEVVKDILKYCPSIDILGCNSYGGIGILADEVRASGWEKPYIVTEWGSDGNWEVEKTSWGAEIEECSTGKAAQKALRYGLIAGDREKCLGSYAFHWGSKQETTPTWFNMFLEDGRATESVHTVQYLWTGSVPEEQAPRITNLMMNETPAIASVVLAPGEQAEASVHLLGGAWSHLSVRWELTPESTDKGFGGDPEDRPPSMKPDRVEQGNGRLVFKAPCQPGAYRLFLYVMGEGNTAATANFPFLVK